MTLTKSDVPICGTLRAGGDIDVIRRGVELVLQALIGAEATEVGVFANPRPGSPRRFCSPACRQAAYRRRRAGAGEDAPLLRSGGRNRSLRPIEEVRPIAD